MITPPQTQDEQNSEGALALGQDESYNRLFDYGEVKSRTTKILSSWKPEEDVTVIRRNTRNVEVDVESLHREGRLKGDEVLIPIRVIDTNIRREQPPYLAFLKQSRRLAIFKCVEQKQLDTQQLEGEFTDGLKYNGWEIPYHKCIDGAQTHGWDSVEVEFDTSKPMHVCVSHVGHENLIPDNLDFKDIQDCEEIFRKYSVPVTVLKNLVAKHGFVKDQADLLIEKATRQNPPQSLDIYKRMHKYQGTVYVSWISIDDCHDWLRPPQPLFMGRVTKQTKLQDSVDPMTGLPVQTPTVVDVPLYEELYPYKIFRYSETEESKITKNKGRVFFDGPKQEAQIAIWSLTISNLIRSANVFASPEQPDSTGGNPKKLDDVNLEPGCIYSVPMRFWHTEAPDPELLKIAEGLEIRSQVESGQVAFAAQNRQDSRKTATEVMAAQQQNDLLNSVQVTLFSTFLRDVFAHVWIIVQSQAIQGLINLLQVNGQNDIQRLSLTYEVFAAGDVDVIQRAEKLQRRLAMWPIVAQTPLAMVFLSDILQEAFPEDFQKYAMVIQQAQQQNDMAGKLWQMLKMTVTDDTGQLKPEYQQFGPQLQQMQQMMEGGGMQMGNQQQQQRQLTQGQQQ